MMKKQIINKIMQPRLTHDYSMYFDGFVKIEAILKK